MKKNPDYSNKYKSTKTASIFQQKEIFIQGKQSVCQNLHKSYNSNLKMFSNGGRIEQSKQSSNGITEGEGQILNHKHLQKVLESWNVRYGLALAHKA